ncbi:C6 transcription factor [Phlyctema vagabunda]|uniref:C6 transcription factor n=1 Tax=Phlyctema vagabunda TaxID=108571 RepID=A0ABR4PUR0_9HELO
MNGPLRNKQGCWTCRLRKKKCDETHPQCSTCETLHITCYGYGPRPEWMDGGEKEKAIANNIKETVKRNSRRKGRLAASLSQLQDRYRSQKAVQPAPKTRLRLPEPSPGGPTANPIQSNSPDTLINSSPEPVQQDHSADHVMHVATLSSSESNLLMHFLDYVFPLQYPLYKPRIAEGGRGWLLPLLMRSKPLFHAALGVSAYHRETMLLTESRNAQCIKAIAEQEKHLERCLKEFRESLEAVGRWIHQSCPKDGLGILSTSVQLIFFDLFAGCGESWQIHLKAACTFYLECYKSRRKQNQMNLSSEPSNTHLGHEFAAFDGPSEDLALHTFMSGVVIWLDIISSITAGQSPRLLSVHASFISPSSPIKLDSIMGCENWAMNLLGCVSALHGSRTQALQSGTFDPLEFQRQADELRERVRQGLTENFLRLLGLSEQPPSEIYGSTISPSKATTRIFALTASVYLRMVVSGVYEGADTDADLDEVMVILQTKVRTEILHALICPLYLLGCAARPQDEDFFRAVFSSLPVLDPSLEHRAKLLPLLEETWQARKTSACPWTWQENIRLSQCNLLLI